MVNVKVSMSDGFDSLTVELSNGYSLESKDIFKYCFKGKPFPHQRRKNSTFAFAQYISHEFSNDSSLGIHNFMSPVKHHKKNTLFDFVDEIEDIKIDLAAFYKKFKEIYGISASILRRIISSYVIGELIEDSDDFPNREKYVNALCKGSNSHTHFNKVVLLNRNKSVVNQLENDGLKNLIPIALIVYQNCDQSNMDLFKESPTKFMKGFFGKSFWKKLTKNSFTRNALFTKRFGRNPEIMKFFMDLETPSTFLKYSTSSEAFHLYSIIDYLIQNLSNENISEEINRRVIVDNIKSFIKSYKISDKLHRRMLMRDLSMIMDAVRTYLTDPEVDYRMIIDYKTNLHDILREHDNIIQLYRIAHPPLRSIYDKPLDFSWISNKFKLEGEIDGVPYKILDSANALDEEAFRMDHCVDTYKRRVGTEQYLVIHLGEESPNGITVGLTVGKEILNLNQAYSYHNSLISDNDEDLVDKLRLKLSDEYAKPLQSFDCTG